MSGWRPATNPCPGCFPDDPAARERARCDLHPTDPARPWSAAVASYGGLGSAYFYRGRVESPWPPEVGRPSLRSRECGHKRHRTVRLAFQCAQRLAARLNAEDS